jgi:hypothetical protein
MTFEVTLSIGWHSDGDGKMSAMAQSSEIVVHQIPLKRLPSKGFQYERFLLVRNNAIHEAFQPLALLVLSGFSLAGFRSAQAWALSW